MSGSIRSTPVPQGGDPELLQPMSRPEAGSQGRRYKVKVNAFELTKRSMQKLGNKEARVFLYDVKITPEGSPPRLNRELWAHLANELRAFADVSVVYDSGALAFSPVELPAKEGAWTIELFENGLPSKGRQFNIAIKFTKEINLSSLVEFLGTGGAEGDTSLPDVQSATQALNVMVQHHPMLVFPTKGSSFFPPPPNFREVEILKGLEIWRGYYSSLRPGPGRLFLNVDLTSQPFYKGGNLASVLMEVGRELQRGQLGPPPNLNNIARRLQLELNRYLRGLKVTLLIKDAKGKEQSRKVKSLERLSAADSVFEADGRHTNVVAYFKAAYNVTLKNPGWPCVRVSKIALWPIELCDVAIGQKYPGKLDPNQTAQSLKLTTIDPVPRVNSLVVGLTHFQPVNNASALDQWGLEMEKTLMEVDARELKPPNVYFSNLKQPAQINNGVWNMRGLQYHIAAPIENWMVLVFDSERNFRMQDVQRSVGALIDECRSAGMVVKNDRPPIYHAEQFGYNCEGIQRWIIDRGNDLVRETKRPPSLIIFYLNTKPADIYSAVKRFGDQDKGIATQCLQIQKVKKAKAQYYANVALKINVKLGGTNSILDQVSLGVMATKRTMVFGADLTHAAPGSNTPSIAALVGSLDKTVAKYGTSVRVQHSRIEVIGDLNAMVHELLIQYIKVNETRPEQLIFFRDGISEGQFVRVSSMEVAAIRIACLLIDREYKPTLTYIVCGKRHHISFIPSDRRDGDQKNNARAGMTVDTGITSPFQFDWYTQSHASLLGTGRSAHYTVLIDESRFTSDQLQQVVYNLCHTYARCTRSVSICAPAYYAAQVCTRALHHLKSLGDDDNTTTASGSSSVNDQEREKLLGEYKQRLKGIHKNLSQSLYFM